MKQLVQQLKFGKMEIIEVPFPVMGEGQVLVRNYYSVISPGTEAKTVSDARKGYLAKAMSRQKEVRQIIDMIRTDGFVRTYNIVMNKLEAPSPLGYSSAGEIIAVGQAVADFKVGDRVACGGNEAVHADVVAVSKNLCVKIPENVDLRHAAFTTIASIAIQGIRQADLRIGENCTVIGLGIIGLLTIQILRAAGIRTIAIDINPQQVIRAKECGADMALNRSAAGINGIIDGFTRGNGSDAVIITASSQSNDPLELAGEISRKKGKVIIVGAVPAEFSRVHYYRKELDLRMSSSYGPGRYDPDYEIKGIDYPVGYVRFTENRNMQTFVDLLESGSLNIGMLISHSFNLIDALQAYNMILEKKESVAGIVIEYEGNKLPEREVVIKNDIPAAISYGVGFIGAGNFAQNILLPRLKDKVKFTGIVTSEGANSKYVAEKYGFSYCTDSPDRLLNDKSTGTIFVLTRHNTHAEYVIMCLKAGKNVFVEKPLAITHEELENIRTARIESTKEVILGFNRRFAPFVEKVRSMLDPLQKKALNIRVNAGILPKDHWVHDPEIGGGRIVGEACHFIDLAVFLAGSRANSIHTSVMKGESKVTDTISVSLEFENGSLACINYFSNGNRNLAKENIEVFCNGTIFLIDDFRELIILNEKSRKKIKSKIQDKGHCRQFELIERWINNGEKYPLSFEEIYHSSLLTLEAVRSARESRVIKIN